MKKLLLVLMIAGLAGVWAGEIAAQVTPRADRRQKVQKHRVRAGVKSGSLTRREGNSIKRSLKRNKRYEKRAKSDGKVTWRERKRLNRMERRSSRKIYRKKHNSRHR
jgi:hypothetical protein